MQSASSSSVYHFQNHTGDTFPMFAPTIIFLQNHIHQYYYPVILSIYKDHFEKQP